MHELLLDTPTQAAAPNAPVPALGRAPRSRPGTDVSIEADSGAGFERVASATAASDGAFSTQHRADDDRRATAPSQTTATSEPVELPVLDRRIALSVRRLRGRVRLRARVTPAASDGRIVLQIYLPQRFGWWPVQTAKLGTTIGRELHAAPAFTGCARACATRCPTARRRWRRAGPCTSAPPAGTTADQYAPT